MYRIDTPIPLGDFTERYLRGNQPVHFGSFLTEDWPARSLWCHPLRSINFSFLYERYGDSMVTAVDCCEREFNDMKRLSMRFSDFLQYWQYHNQGTLKSSCEASQDHSQGTFMPSFKASLETQSSSSVDVPMQQAKGSGALVSQRLQASMTQAERILYVKDWHLFQEYPEDARLYTVPPYFQDDWLNMFCLQSSSLNNQDYRFVYMGVNGSWTPLHADVYRY
jgi:hypothetical protein